MPLFIQGVTLDTYISHVMDSHPFLTTQKLQSLQHQHIIAKTQGITDWNLDSSIQFNQSQPAQVSSFTPKRTDRHHASFNGTKTSWKTGSTIQFFSSTSQLNQDVAELNFNGTPMSFGNAHFFENQIGALYSYPLLNNKKGILTRYPYNHAVQSQLSLDLQLLQSKEHFLLSVLERYMQWVLLDTIYDLTDKKYNVAFKSLNILKKKYNANLIDKLDILRQENYIRTIKQELLKINAERNALITELSLQSSLESSKFKSPDYDIKTQLSIDDSILFSNTLAYKLAVTELKTHELEKEYFTESRKPKLDLGLSYSLNGSDTSFSDAFSFNDYTRYMSLTFSRPLYNISNNADLERKEIDIQKTEESLKLHALNFNIAKEKSLSELNSYKDIVDLNVSQIKLAKQTVREEKKLYNKGRGNLTFVLQAQDNAHESEIRYVRNQIFLQLLSYRYYALTDQLLALFNKSDT